jgi:hypothetical protein
MQVDEDPTVLSPAGLPSTTIQELSGHLKWKRPLSEDPSELPPAKWSFISVPEIVSVSPPSIPLLIRTPNLMQGIQELGGSIKQKRCLSNDPAKLPPAK